MRARWVSVLSLVVVAAACGPKVRPGLNVKGDRLTATFDRPMVAADAVGHDLERAPLEVKPAVAGKYRWADAKTLVLVPAEPLPRSTRFEVTAPRGTVALDGLGLDRKVEWSFETERLHLSFPSRGTRPPEQWATADQLVALQFNQPVRAKEVGDRCRYESGAGSVDAAVRNGADLEDPREAFSILPAKPLALGTKWTFRCDGKLAGAEGPLPLAPVDPDAGAPSYQIAFETYGAFKVDTVEPRGDQIPPDDVHLAINFSNPLGTMSGAPPVTIEPAVAGFPEYLSVSGPNLSMYVTALKPNTRYTIKVGGEISDRFGQKLAGPVVASFQTGNGTPRLDVETGAWVVEATRSGYVGWARNLTKLEADVVAVPEAKLDAVAAALNWWDDDPVDTAKLGLRPKHATIPISGKENQWAQVPIEPAKLLGSDAPPRGFYYVSLRAPEVPYRDTDQKAPRAEELLLNFTNLGLTAKLSGPSGLVWVTRLDDGQPQPGADVSIRDAKGKVLWHGTTDADGVAMTPGRAQLLPKAKAAPRRRFEEEEGDGEEGDFGEGDYTGSRAELLVFAHLGGDATWVNPSREGGLASWNFHVATDASRGAEQLRGFLHSDRGLYRPGETIHLRGLARLARLGGPLRVPAGRKVKVTIHDPRGEELLSRSVAVTRYGGFSVDLPLSASARLGDYGISAELPEGFFNERVSVQQYRAASFEVKLAPPSREPVAGGDVRLSAEARYLYGAPLKGGKLTWRVYRRPRSVSFPRLPGYSFSDARQWDNYWDSRSAAGEMLVTEADQRLDGNGKARLSVPLSKADFQTNQDLMVTAEVQDETNQTIAANIAVPAHRAGVYFGIDSGSPVLPAGKPHAIKLVAVDPKGNGVAASARWKVVKRDWSCAYEAWGYHGSYRCEKKETEVRNEPVALAAGGPTEVSFTPPGPGTYFLVVEGSDAAGNATATAEERWAWGDGEAAWQSDDGERFDLVPDKESYQVGETAHLLLKTGVHDATGLLTIERTGVHEKTLVKIGKGTSTLDVPIKPGYGPNVYASVMLVKGRSGKGPRGLPLMKMGVATLTVDTADKRLAVAVTTDRPSYKPGETVTADVQVTGEGGKPVQAEVALAAADEGVLSLIGFKTPDPLATFYAPWGLGVTTSTQYERLARLPEPGEARYATGGDMGAPGSFRSRFLSTAYWNPAVETDAAGHARVTFQAPDNLTAYRLMAVAADAGERFGSGDKRLTVRKPLQLLGAMPRFLLVDDEPRGGVLVINDTGAPGKAVVDFEIKGAKVLKGAHQEVDVPAGGRVPVTIALRAEHAGELRVRVKATLGAETDGLELKLPVQVPGAVETKLVAQGSTPGTVTIPGAKLPAGVVPGTATLEVSVDPDGVAGLEEGLRDLIEYPYGCLEQTTSRLVPLVAVEELARSLKLAGLEGPRLKTYIAAGLEKLERFQTDDGGFSLWMGGKSEPFLTAFALWGLKIAEDAGHPIKKGMIPRGVTYLREALARDAKLAGPIDDLLGEMGSKAFSVHVLAELGSPDAAYATKLLEKKEQLPRFGQAFLARALALNLGAGHSAVTGLLDDLARAEREIGQGGKLVAEARDHNWSMYMSDDTRTTAIATDAFLDLRPSEPTLPALVKGLLAGRVDGRWINTQDDLFALIALVHYVKSRGVTHVSVDARLGDKPVLSGPLVGKATHIRRATVPLGAGEAPPLVLAATGGDAFYSVMTRYRRDLAHQPAEEHGITLRRDYLDPATDKPLPPVAVTGGQAISIRAGQMVRVRVSVSSSEWRAHLAVDDPLPAGLEAVNTKLVTSGNQPGERDSDPWSISARELRDDRVLVFMDRVWPRLVTYTYLARATTPGSYKLPGATVGEMYQPDIFARTAPGLVVVTPAK
jgi:uncharacterized protein YfaS (alpha-2-macroglobulin family)